MPNSLRHIANVSLNKPSGINQLIKKEYDTDDIIDLIKVAHKKGLSETKKLAATIPGNSITEYCKNLWELVKYNINYKVDPIGSQWVKSPTRLWHDKTGDCKSFSILIGTTLQNKGIPFRYRFVSYAQGSQMVTHVYIIVPISNKGSQPNWVKDIWYGQKYITLDAVYTGFNLEKKPFYYKKDLQMEGLSYLSGISSVGKLTDLGNKDIDKISEAEMDLLIARDRMLTEKAIVERMQGIGSFTAEKYQDSIDMLEDALAVVGEHSIGDIDDYDVEAELSDIAEDAINGVYSIAGEICGIGDIGARRARRQQRRATRRARRVVRRTKRRANPRRRVIRNFVRTATRKTGRFLKKVAKVAKKGAKAILRVATAPARLAIKGILEISLPKAAPFFLYLFLNDKALLAKSPAIVRKKRAKAEKVANFIVNGIKMKRKHFMGIVRNGIMKQYGKSPEKVIAEQTRGIAGIGAFPAVAIGVLVKIVQKIAKLFKRRSERISTGDAPAESDWASLMKKGGNAVKSFNTDVAKQPAAQQFAFDVKNQASDAGDGSGSFDNGGSSIWDSLK